MLKQSARRIKKALPILLAVSLLVSLTAITTIAYPYHDDYGGPNWERGTIGVVPATAATPVTAATPAAGALPSIWI